MQQYDSEKAARVWQRVRGESQQQDTSELAELPGLAAEEAALAAMYRQMAKNQPECMGLFRDCGRSAAILRGISVFQDQQPGKAVPPAGSIRNSLRLCYAKTLRCIGEYEKLSSHPEYGCVFRRLSETKREHACKILELAGSGK